MFDETRNRFIRLLCLFVCLLIGQGARTEESCAPSQPELMAEAPSVTPFIIKRRPVMLWENRRRPERLLWQAYAFSVIETVHNQLDTAQDITDFCPKYRTITHEQQVLAWAQLFEAIAYFESSFNPANRTLETTEDAGIDEVTGLPVMSEGLLQLSYQDTKLDEVGSDCHFDWAHDQKLVVTDLHRTILNPYTNLYCGIHIMAKFVKDNGGKIVVSRNYYWSTLQSGNKDEEQTPKIQGMVRRLPFCQ